MYVFYCVSYCHLFYTEIELLAAHGILLPPNMHGLTDDQIEDLKLKDEYAETCTPSGGILEAPDPVGRRNGKGRTKHFVPFEALYLIL